MTATVELRGAVKTTVDPARPVTGELRLAIAQPAAGEAVYVTFPWGDAPDSLCTEAEAAAITLVPDEDSRDWTVVRSSAPPAGYYWILTPPADPPEIAGFVFDGIVSTSPADLPPTLCFASCADGDTTLPPPSFWREVPLAVAALDASPRAATPRTPVTLSWTTTGARGCSLDPGGDGLPPVGELEVRPAAAETYRLVARGADGASAVERALRVEMATGWTQLTTEPVVLGDAPVLLQTGTEILCLQPEAGIALASIDGRTWERREPALPTRPWGAAGGALWDRLLLLGGVPTDTADAGASVALASTDGRRWTELTAAAWSPQCRWPGVAFYGDRVFVLGGLGSAGTPLGTVQTSYDGATWTATPVPPWSPRVRPGVAALGEDLWLSGGLAGWGPGANTVVDVWRLGFGGTWEQGPPPPWNGERALTRLAAVDGTLYALTIPLGEAPIQLWALREPLSWEPVDRAAPVRSSRLLGARVEVISFLGGVLVVSDRGAWWWNGTARAR
jgi:hypothetical protein